MYCSFFRKKIRIKFRKNFRKKLVSGPADWYIFINMRVLFFFFFFFCIGMFNASDNQFLAFESSFNSPLN